MADSTVTLNPSSMSVGDMPRTAQIPIGIAMSGLMSNTSSAASCFIDQQFSAKLQAFMIGYVNSIYSDYSVYK
jgi:hypothetical protein